MKYDEKALEEATNAISKYVDDPEILRAAISAYCEKAGVVMVPGTPTDRIEDQDDTLGRYLAMIRASEEED